VRSHAAVLVMLAACFAPPRDVPDPPSDAGSDAAACAAGERRCDGAMVSECRDGAWQSVAACANLCTRGGCVAPASCCAGLALCGPSGSDSCCRSLAVPGGAFIRSYDGVTPDGLDRRFAATVTGFHLDQYEVTAARFQAFVAAYPASRPVDGAGKNPRDAEDRGWLSAWTALLPATASALASSVLCGGLTSQAATQPVRCVSWYLAQAFCIWDGGRLPTEAEWNFAAAGGGEQRVYPWSVPASSAAITPSQAVYATDAPSVPGAQPAGDGRWGHADLAGNVSEWVFDNYTTPYPTETCRDCANHTAAAFRGVRGGSFLNARDLLFTSYRSALDPAATRAVIGFRCARDPAP
jgi:formylglycine-generating enzyme